ncbi:MULTISPECIES: hypothetical protein [unclassified Mesorhizobium]|uniref:hypothetical protein n=1 Tax=unclassified Mesorhizobium TaxID=325217 RepID=UPI001128FD74|nr:MULTISPECIES: hypothetical protein [unclassified Mesorhizobium]TPK95685.1 hypothetical protein FJ567_22660 [Mesorhizobium sp. B2-4-16]TPL67243.1 hypothetical protein FJ956_19555 [Mesorhizobium sp. B2-4-3]
MKHQLEEPTATIAERGDRVGSKLINVEGSISFSAAKDPDKIIYYAHGTVFIYPKSSFDFVRISSSFGYQIANGTIDTILTFYGGDGHQLCPDINYSFGFGCGEQNLQISAHFKLPSDIFNDAHLVRWKAVPGYLGRFRIRPCS